MSRSLARLRFTFIGNSFGKNRFINIKASNFQQNNEKKPPELQKIDTFKSNPYFSKYEAKLKAIYK